MIAVDTNILVYAHRQESPLNLEATASLKELTEGSMPWGLPVSCISEFVKVVTQHRNYNPPTEPEKALAFIAGLVSSPSCSVLKPGSNFLDHFFGTVMHTNIRGAKVFDAQIVAVCLEHGVDKILTCDRDFERFEGITVETLGAVHEPAARYGAKVTVQDFLPT